MAPRSTHDVRIDGDEVRKTFRSNDRGEAEREWFALRHLARFAGGLAPRPLRAGLGSSPAWVTMTRLDGATPSEWTAPAREAVVVALQRLWSVPATGLPEQNGSPAFRPAFWRDLLAHRARTTDPGVEQAGRRASAWVRGTEIDRLLTADGPVVLGQGDPNVDNFLITCGDGDPVARVVDFEDCGRSRRAFEVANLAEHLANRTSGFEQVVDRFDAPASDLGSYRRLIALYWFIRLSDGAAADGSTLPRAAAQAERLQLLLDTDA